MSFTTHICTSIEADPAASQFISHLTRPEVEKIFNEGIIYYDFPLYRNDEGDMVVAAKIFIITSNQCVFAIGTSNSGDLKSNQAAVEGVEDLYGFIYSRLVKNKRLRSGINALSVKFSAVVFSPLTTAPNGLGSEIKIFNNADSLVKHMATMLGNHDKELYGEVLSTIEGTKALVKNKIRPLAKADVGNMGAQAMMVENEIGMFDRQQRLGFITNQEGPERIRGLAGSGKTVLLAMKAALAHIRNPAFKILYTFHTKSLYQQVKRLITRFYRQYNDTDPDWNNLNILHGWGGHSMAGVYYNTCKSLGVVPVAFEDAARSKPDNPFDYACAKLLGEGKIEPNYDIIYIDEGQDFPISFVRLCYKLAKNGKFTLAYDDLQTIFQPKAPSAKDIFGSDSSGKPLRSFEQDIILHKVYRNPREILVCAHALGFGIYGPKVKQMLEDKDHWESVGYKIMKGNFTPGSEMIIERPEEYSPSIISGRNKIENIVSARVFSNLDEETSFVASDIVKCTKDGLRPDDILVIAIDDRHSKSYLSEVRRKLKLLDVDVNNIHDAFGSPEFQVDGQVTLSTVHKAKGNEAFLVYVVGIDALYPNPDARQRNMIFTSMTRAKGWLRICGSGSGAMMFVGELNAAKHNFPRLVFKYPREIVTMKMDMEEKHSNIAKVRLQMAKWGEDLSSDEIEELLRDIKLKKRPSGGGRSSVSPE